MRYFVEESGNAKGPYTVGQLRSMWTSGTLTGETRHCPEGSDEWVPLRLMAEELDGPSPGRSTSAADRERTYLADSAAGVRVTSSRLVFPGTTYALSNVTSVSLGRRPPTTTRNVGALLVTVGIGLTAIDRYDSYFRLGNPDEIHASGLLWMAVALLLGGLALALLPRTKYVVSIVTAAGQCDGMASKDREFIAGVVGAIDRAIADRG